MDNRYEQNFLFFEEEGHKYNDSFGNEYLSVTTLIHDNYVPKFYNSSEYLNKNQSTLSHSSQTIT